MLPAFLPGTAAIILPPLSLLSKPILDVDVKRYIMSQIFITGQRVRIIRVDDIPYGQKYSYLEATLDKTGVIQGKNDQSSGYLVLLEQDGSLIEVTEGCLEIA
jgi:hypothetical protein